MSQGQYLNSSCQWQPWTWPHPVDVSQEVPVGAWGPPGCPTRKPPFSLLLDQAALVEEAQVMLQTAFLNSVLHAGNSLPSSFQPGQRLPQI